MELKFAVKANTIYEKAYDVIENNFAREFGESEVTKMLNNGTYLQNLDPYIGNCIGCKVVEDRDNIYFEFNTAEDLTLFKLEWS